MGWGVTQGAESAFSRHEARGSNQYIFQTSVIFSPHLLPAFLKFGAEGIFLCLIWWAYGLAVNTCQDLVHTDDLIPSVYCFRYFQTLPPHFTVTVNVSPVSLKLRAAILSARDLEATLGCPALDNCHTVVCLALTSRCHHPCH